MTGFRNLWRVAGMCMLLPLVTARDIDCSMSDSTRCDCIYQNGADNTMGGTDCRVCKVDGNFYCVLWGSPGWMYGPLCDATQCPPGTTWLDGKISPGNCYCDWNVKPHDRYPCPTPAGDCKCSYDDITPSGTTTSTLPGATCVICPEGPAAGGYYCTERGNRANKYGPVCMGNELGPQCTGKGCVCNWMTTMDGPGWRNDTV
ncbi:hypothetical protein BU24DRAFT_489000 [Aaosphaeria arxii CBS 175.79]|uniref:Uncharacterized protein n=1 Tax=Aaosphaeria arxii CBS 175.79 TaxID=1450172 RepID=A0A6A5Y2Z3_9PLEO|nr:uncharacterized protein BU24DRAFT_489000 [Aaosphaeria arxii CBS 175.79]KAF2018944.1 hypothetical protein BU24DRAFT_489000 [Aaosphaeria arxii CBS 175.79]